MHTLIIIGLTAWCVIAITRQAPAADDIGSRSFYDRSGSFAGSTVTRGNSTSAYDRNGSFGGTIIRNSDGSSSFYDRNGHFAGSSTKR
jgi:hypothetical protein